MVKIFRRIRQELLSEGKAGRYLMYALGEIVLVVLGILIALQINIWNEHRKIDENNRIKLQAVQQELLVNLSIAETIIAESNEKLAIMVLFLSDTLESNDFLNNEVGGNLRLLLWAVSVFTPNTEAYNTLLESQDNLSSSYSDIIQDLNYLYINTNKYISLSNDTQHDIYLREKEHLSNTYAWFSKVKFNPGYISQEQIDYLLTDPFYRNRVSEMYEMVLTMNNTAKMFKHRSVLIYQEIAQQLSQEITAPTILNAYYEPSSMELETYVGTYLYKGYESFYLRVLSKEGELYLTWPNSDTLKIYLTDANSFYLTPNRDVITEFIFEDSLSALHSLKGLNKQGSYTRAPTDN